jgi:hypothetical protein
LSGSVSGVPHVQVLTTESSSFRRPNHAYLTGHQNPPPRIGGYTRPPSICWTQQEDLGRRLTLERYCYKGVDFLSNLIIIDSQDIDIILGMYWLRKYEGVILCTKRTICSTQEDGTTVEFMAAISSNQISVLNQVKGMSLDEIRIVREFLDELLLTFLMQLSQAHEIVNASFHQEYSPGIVFIFS